MSRSTSPRYFIVPRRVPDWKGLSERLRRDGRVPEPEFIPEVLPPGFPPDLGARIDLWNRTFRLDFFTCRARLAEIAGESWDKVAGATLISGSADLQRAIQDQGKHGKRFLFVDDDDWFNPDLVGLLEPEIGVARPIVRWGAPVFHGGWQQRLQPRLAPRLLVKTYLYARSRPLLEAVYRRLVDWLPQEPDFPLVPGDHVLYTNNYAVTERYLHFFNDLGCVADHSDASRLAMVSRLSIQSRPRLMLSATNKHPCSAGAIGRAVMNTSAGDALRRHVEEYVRRGRASVTPPAMAWATRSVDRTLAVFEEALG
jgi:hypothetical protein